MKFLPPIIALAIVAAWLIIQRRSITTTEGEVVRLREQVRQGRASSGSDGSDPSLASRIRDNPVGSPGQPLDWKRVGERVAASQGGSSVADMRAMMSLQKRLMEMDADELVEALDEIIALDISDAIRTQLESLLAGQLAQKDPQMALERFGDRLGRMRWQLSQALRTWADDDPAAASAWLDHQIAAGEFESTSLDGQNRQHIHYEAAIIGSLLASDPDLASRRLAAIPEYQRSNVLLQGWTIQLKPNTQSPYASLVREQLPHNQHAMVLAQAGDPLSRGEDGYRKIREYLDRINPTGQERTAIARKLADNKFRDERTKQGFDPEKVSKTYDWLSQHAPGEADAITGASLGNLGGNFEQNLAMVTKLHEESGSDDLLTAFLDQKRAIDKPGTVMPLIMKISDPQRRSEILEKYQQAHRDPDAFAP